jgi:hypothetical protein
MFSWLVYEYGFTIQKEIIEKFKSLIIISMKMQ